VAVAMMVQHGEVAGMRRMFNKMTEGHGEMEHDYGCVNRGEYIFDNKEIVEKDGVSWNTIIGGFVMHGHGDKALDVFIAQLKQQGFYLDAVHDYSTFHFELLH
jgi:pentatricopeptide repeat protein